MAIMAAMNRVLPAVLALALSAPAFAQDSRSPVAEGNNWSIDRADCSIDASWSEGPGLWIGLHGDHLDFSLANRSFKGFVANRVVAAAIGSGGHRAGAQPVEAIGRTGQDDKFYVAEVDDALLDGIAAAGDVQVWRGDVLLADLEVSGLDGALAAMRACASNLLADAQEAVPAAEAARAAREAAEAAARPMGDEDSEPVDAADAR